MRVAIQVLLEVLDRRTSLTSLDKHRREVFYWLILKRGGPRQLLAISRPEARYVYLKGRFQFFCSED